MYSLYITYMCVCEYTYPHAPPPFGIQVLLAGLGISEGNDLTFTPGVVCALLLGLGAAAGPIQPIAAELAVEVRQCMCVCVCV